MVVTRLRHLSTSAALVYVDTTIRQIIVYNSRWIAGKTLLDVYHPVISVIWVTYPAAPCTWGL